MKLIAALVYFCLSVLANCINAPSRSYDAFTGVTNFTQRLTEGCNGSTDVRFQNILINGSYVYVGATNQILQFSVSEVSLVEVFVNGPDKDSEKCFGPYFCTTSDICLSAQLRCTNNHNKLLIPYRDRLLACGTLQTVCDLVTLNNVSVRYPPVDNNTKCRQSTLIHQFTSVVSRSLDLPDFAAIHLDESVEDGDLFYLGKSNEIMKTLLAPSSMNRFFTTIDDSSEYIQSIATPSYTFHAVWTTVDYAYFVWTDRTSSQVKLARLCHKTFSDIRRPAPSVNDPPRLDAGIRTYTEITLQCSSNGTKLVNALSARYTRGNLFLLFVDNGNTALCVSSLTSINQEIDSVRNQCWNSSVKVDYIRTLGRPGENLECRNLSNYFNENYKTCAFPSDRIIAIFISPISSNRSLNMILTVQVTAGFLREEVISTFVITEANNLSTAFLGTTAGKILKMQLGINASVVSEQVLLSNQKVRKMAVDESGDFIFTITEKNLYKVSVAECGQYQTCTSCMESRDIYCGWCVLESRCTRKENCPDSNEKNKWIKPDMASSDCPRVSAIKPNAIAVENSSQINMTFSGTSLQRDLNYTCEFATNDNLIPFVTSVLQNYNLSRAQCIFPATRATVIPQNSDYENVTLNIVNNGNILASGSLRLFNCSRITALNQYTMCSSCVISQWGCRWCRATDTCSSSTYLSPVTNQEYCPVVTNITNLPDLISVGMTKTFRINTTRLQSPFNNYVCQYIFCGIQKSSSAVVNSLTGIAECSATAELLTCPRNTTSIRVSLGRGRYIVDVLDESAVTIATLFNCSVDTENCGKCMNFRHEINQCEWCSSTKTCVAQSTCPSAVTDISNCEAASITSVTPLNGPVNGGTVVTINGRNLGSRVEDISRVLVGSVVCDVMVERYLPSDRIVCRTQNVSTVSESSVGVISILTSYSSTPVNSSDIFNFQVVSANSFFPLVTLNMSTVQINGSNLHVGNSARIYFQGHQETGNACENRRSTFMLCTLPSVPTFGESTLVVKLDGYTKTFDDRLKVVEVPKVVEVLVSGGKILGFKSGGGNVEIRLSSVSGIQTAELQVDQLPVKGCVVASNTSIVCAISPLERPLSSRSRRQTSNDGQGGKTYQAVLIFNGIHKISVGQVSYFSDPVLSQKTLPCGDSSASSTTNATSDELSGTISTLQLNGKGFDSTKAKKSDYTVLLISEKTTEKIRCRVTFISLDSLFCQASSSKLNSYRGQRLTIEVTIGELSLQNKGVEFCPPDEETDLLGLYIGIGVVAFFLVAISIGAFIWYKQKQKQQELEKQLILQKLDDLENKTREAGRNAYFELQVGYMNNLADNLTSRIIYLPPENYFTQAFFNLAYGHPVLDKMALQHEPTEKIAAIEDWLTLLKSKDFLMTFIRTLETQKHFTVQEKGNVASLLTVCLFPDMPYFTSIMFDLLAELIQKHVQKNPKLLLRRSESVVEKMVSHWLSITLYDECIMEKSGEPIFLLSKAIHYLVSSAPCDVIAHKALNSLNESTLLGQEINHDSLVLRAAIEELGTGQVTAFVDVTAVNVDTITQTKAKIIDAVYKDKPYSECPKPDELDFGLYSGPECNKGSGIILSDVDSTSIIEGNHTKLNTLKHYNVPNKASVVLRPAGILSPAVSDNPKSPLIKQKKSMYHLIHPREDEAANGGYVDIENGSAGKKTGAYLEGLINKPFQEIYLTRMVRSKTALQEYVDKVFKSILCPEPIPFAVRYLFQFLDREAARHKISDPEVIHIWKTNSLLLRYWVNVLKNPEFLFDLHKTIIVDSCLNVITQALIDACTTTNRKLGHDSPSNKLLYAKDAETYKKMVNEFFVQVSNTSWVNEAQIEGILKKNSNQYAEKFNQHVAAQQLSQYLFKYGDQVLEAVKDEGHDRIVGSVEELIDKMNGKVERANPLYGSTNV